MKLSLLFVSLVALSNAHATKLNMDDLYKTFLNDGLKVSKVSLDGEGPGRAGSSPKFDFIKTTNASPTTGCGSNPKIRFWRAEIYQITSRLNPAAKFSIPVVECMRVNWVPGEPWPHGKEIIDELYMVQSGNKVLMLQYPTAKVGRRGHWSFRFPKDVDGFKKFDDFKELDLVTGALSTKPLKDWPNDVIKPAPFVVKNCDATDCDFEVVEDEIIENHLGVGIRIKTFEKEFLLETTEGFKQIFPRGVSDDKTSIFEQSITKEFIYLRLNDLPDGHRSNELNHYVIVRKSQAIHKIIAKADRVEFVPLTENSYAINCYVFSSNWERGDVFSVYRDFEKNLDMTFANQWTRGLTKDGKFLILDEALIIGNVRPYPPIGELGFNIVAPSTKKVVARLNPSKSSQLRYLGSDRFLEVQKDRFANVWEFSAGHFISIASQIALPTNEFYHDDVRAPSYTSNLINLGVLAFPYKQTRGSMIYRFDKNEFLFLSERIWVDPFGDSGVLISSQSKSAIYVEAH